MNYHLEFVKGKFTFPGSFLGVPQFNQFSSVRPYSINEGIHAHTSCEIRCGFDCRVLSAEEFGCYPYEVLDAIIPKGTKYYVGDAHEVVAEKMVLFETEKDFQHYRRWHRVKDLITISDNSIHNRVSEMKFNKVKKSFRKKGTTVLGDI
jgi:hypothetical protein